MSIDQNMPAEERSVDARTLTIDRAHRDAIRLAADVVEEHAGDSGDPAAMNAAASDLDEILDAWDTARRESR